MGFRGKFQAYSNLWESPLQDSKQYIKTTAADPSNRNPELHLKSLQTISTEPVFNFNAFNLMTS